MEIEVSQSGSGPSSLEIIKDGVVVPVTKDTVTASNTIPVPVEVVAASGSPINITAGDLNVQLSDQGVNADVTRVGDGTTQLAIEVGTGAALAKITSSALPAGAATSALQTSANTKLDTLHTDLVAVEGKQDTGNTSLGSIDTKLSSQATAANQAAEALLLGAVTETAPATDTASSGLNGRLQRIAQRLTSLIALLPSSLGQKAATGSLAVVLASDQTLPLPSGAATETTQAANGVLIGAVNETAPGTDTASSGTNGRLQRIAQRLTSLIALLPSSLGQKASTGSLAVVIASDQSNVNVNNVVPTAVTVKQAAITVGTSAVRCTTDGSAVSSTRRYLCVQPTSDTTTARFFLGSSSVTSSGATRGIEVFPGATFERADDAGEYYIISDTAAQTVFIVEQE